jgi:hypothetical protein
MSAEKSSLNVLELIGNTSDAFRLGVLNLANELFVELVDQVAGAFPLLGKEEQIITANKIITSIMSAHQRGDYIGLADELEFRLRPFLEEVNYESAR